MNTYRKGRKAEVLVAEKLRSHGYYTTIKKGSRGPYDLFASKGTRRYAIQVKSRSASMSGSERTALRCAASRHGARALYMHVNRRKIRSRFV